MTKKILPHDHHCSECGQIWCDDLEIVAKPIRPEAQFYMKKVLMKVPGNIVIVGYGPKLTTRVLQATWTSGLEKGVIYAYSLEYGVVEVLVSSLKALERRFGGAFVRVEQGILVALEAVTLPDVNGRIVGVCVGMERNSRRIINPIVCSRRGAQRLDDALPHFERWPEPQHPNATM